jgi:NADPH-dependent glutamate synthase beta subunit-like oxidoreductase/coenzyme F420-reducing hydrogenase delta subunit/ferredoxin
MVQERKGKQRIKVPDFIRIDSEQKTLSIEPVQASPCTAECPLGTNVKAYVSLIAAGRFSEALEVVRRTNPFPGICGRVCPHPCEDSCLRGEIDDPIAISALKRFLADYELRRGIVPRYMAQKKNQGRVAVVGAGPAGLTCAHDLAREGIEVTVFEALPVAGGMMAVGMPHYRLPKDILRIEIAAIESLGVDIRLNTRVGRDRNLEELIEDYDAVFIGAGAVRPRTLGIPGERDVKKGLIDWVRFLRESAFGLGKLPGKNVVIVGGGNTAVDCARVALRLGAEKARVLYRRSGSEMPAYSEEIADAQEEGVEFHFLAAPARLLSEKGKLVGVECARMRLGRKDKSGRRHPVPIPGSQFTIRCEAVIPAIGQEIDSIFLGKGGSLAVSPDNLLVADPDTTATSTAGVFAGGDVVSGAASVVEAIAAGHRAAQSVICYLRDLPLAGETGGESHGSDEVKVASSLPDRAARTKCSRLDTERRKVSFDEVDKGFSEQQAMAEAARCIRCGPCRECVECVGVCDSRQVIITPSGKGPQREMLVRIPSDIYGMVSRDAGVCVSYRSRTYTPTTFTAAVDEYLCRGCGLCEEICGYHAVQVLYRKEGVFTAQVDESICRGCGACIGVCPTGAIDQNCFSGARIHHLIGTGFKENGVKPHVVVFVCRWSPAYDHTSKKAPADVVTVMCLGRIPAGEIIGAFERGADGALLVGCPPGECHYGFGGEAAGTMVERVSHTLSLAGIDRNRVRIVHPPMGGGLGIEEIIRDFSAELEEHEKRTE